MLGIEAGYAYWYHHTATLKLGVYVEADKWQAALAHCCDHPKKIRGKLHDSRLSVIAILLFHSNQYKITCYRNFP